MNTNYLLIFESMRLITLVIVAFISFMVVEPAISTMVDQLEVCSDEEHEQGCDCSCNPFISCESCSGFHLTNVTEVDLLSIDHHVNFKTPIDDSGVQNNSDIFRPPICVS